MNHETYMQAAIDVANQAKQQGGVGIGAVLVNNATGTIVATGGSLVGVTHDPTAHAEVNCIRLASQKQQNDDLFGHTLYSTLEPCHMCLSTAAWARISDIRFGAYRKDVDDSLFDTRNTLGDEQEAAHMNLRENTDMRVVGGILERQCAALLAGYHENFKHS